MGIGRPPSRPPAGRCRRLLPSALFSGTPERRLLPMPSEIWLRPNRRPALVLLCASAAIAVACLIATATAVWQSYEGEPASNVAALAACVAVVSSAVALGAHSRARRPRIYREESQLLFRIAGGRGPLAVPLDVVEAFFLGQGPAHLPGGLGERLETVNLVARLSQRATEWRQRDTDPRLGAWCGGYITVRGTCCEPLTTDVVHRLNRLLTSAKRESARNA